MKNAFLIVLITVLLANIGYAMDDARLLRFPNINKDLITFVYAGDIWSVPVTGGNARRLTSHEGMEIFPRISPDGQWIAFSGEYSGTRQIYVMPAKGGEPRQLTYYSDMGEQPPRGGFDHLVVGWTPDSKHILILTTRTPYDDRIQRFYTVSLEGGLETPLPIPEASFGSFSPDGKKIVYSPISREFRTWKRYKGGRAQDIWIYDLEKNTSEQITQYIGDDRQPFWYKDKIYFVSDRDSKLNFWSYDLNSKEYKQITFHKDFDVLWPSGNNDNGGLIAYENGGYIYVLNLETGDTHKVTIAIDFDNPKRLPYFKDVAQFVSPRGGADISPDGKNAVFDARGDLFVVPADKNGITVNLTRTQGIRETHPAWSPDGKWIAFMSDKTGEYELYMIDSDRKGEPIQLTTNHKIWKNPAKWSPDSKKLLFSDTDRNLNVLDTQTRKMTEVGKGDIGIVSDYQWSGDSKWVMYCAEGKNRLSAIWLYSLVNGKTYQISSGRYNDTAPVFSKDGSYIFFVSNRDFDLDQVVRDSVDEDSLIYPKTARIYAMALTPNAPNLFETKNNSDKNNSDKNAKPEAKKGDIVIDFEGLQGRISVFPMQVSNYDKLVDLDGRLLFTQGNEVRVYDFKTQKDSGVIKETRVNAVSSDGKRLLYKSGAKWGIIDIKKDQKPEAGELNMSHVMMKIDPVKEWEQMYHDGWRIYRDWFYVRNMHGVDWAAMKEKYAPLIQCLGCRPDLDFVFGELLGELNAGHTYVNWGDFNKPKRIEGGLLGAELKADTTAKRYIISKIFKGENWNDETRSPLTEQGIGVREGDYIIRIDDYNVTTSDNPYKFLENTGEKMISITVNSKPSDVGARTYWIKTTKNEQKLRYIDWVESRRKLVDQLSNGRIGYLHAPNTKEEGFREFSKGLYAFNNKEAFIIDDRYNGGGWYPTPMIERLMEKPVAYWYSRDLALRPDPIYTFNGPKVMLINHYSSSGGDYFPYMFQTQKLGLLIGTRTWGGLVGYNSSPALVDGPQFAIPMAGVTDTNGAFVVEGTGVCPDIEVEDRPEEIAKGNDPSLEVAVKQLLMELNKNPVKKPVTPENPVRSRWHEKMAGETYSGCNQNDNNDNNDNKK
ncbi:MAG: S41 family peptidase [Candidatus Omnitrophota bacterium]